MGKNADRVAREIPKLEDRFVARVAAEAAKRQKAWIKQVTKSHNELLKRIEKNHRELMKRTDDALRLYLSREALKKHVTKGRKRPAKS